MDMSKNLAIGVLTIVGMVAPAACRADDSQGGPQTQIYNCPNGQCAPHEDRKDGSRVYNGGGKCGNASIGYDPNTCKPLR